MTYNRGNKLSLRVADNCSEDKYELPQGSITEQGGTTKSMPQIIHTKSCGRLHIFSEELWLLHRNLTAYSRGVKHLTKSTFAEIG